jgi:D-serine dehydratase
MKLEDEVLEELREKERQIDEKEKTIDRYKQTVDKLKKETSEKDRLIEKLLRENAALQQKNAQ